MLKYYCFIYCFFELSIPVSSDLMSLNPINCILFKISLA